MEKWTRWQPFEKMSGKFYVDTLMSKVLIDDNFQDFLTDLNALKASPQFE